MLKILFNFNATDEDRRRQLQDGAILFYQATEISRALVSLAATMVHEAFGECDPEHAQESMSVEDFIAIVGPLKTRFTNALETKQLIRKYLAGMGVDPADTYFDVPRLRVVPHSDYLSSGVAYAYKAHRDIWYSSPTAQVNWWLPVFDVTPQRTMAFYPGYWKRPLSNTSENFDYDEWVRIGRNAALSQGKVDTRRHPLPLTELSSDDEFRYGAASGDAVLFSASQLHATVPNESDATRFSIDFRTICLSDLREGRGGANVDCRSRGTTLGDFLRVDDFVPIEAQKVEELIR